MRVTMPLADLSGAFACNRDIQDEKFFLPSADGWTNSFNTTGVRLRIVKVGDENCNGQWDDFVLGTERTEEVNSLGYMYGFGYSCAATYNVAGKIVPFTEHKWDFIVYLYTNSSCGSAPVSKFTAESKTSTALSGVVPTAMVSSGTSAGCWDEGGGYYSSFGQYWNQAKCRYTYQDDTSYF